MTLFSRMLVLAAGLCLALSSAGSAQLIDKKAISLALARKMIAAAEAQAAAMKLSESIAVVDEDGMLIAFERMDDTQVAGVQIAIAKARTAATFKRPTKSFVDRLSHGDMGPLGLGPHPPTTSQGGLPVMVDGKIIGGIGASGAPGAQDAVVAAAGAAVVK